MPVFRGTCPDGPHATREQGVAHRLPAIRAAYHSPKECRAEAAGQLARPVRPCPIGIHIAEVNVGDAFAEQVQLPWLASVTLAALGVLLVFHIRTDDRLGHYYRLRRVEPETLLRTLYFLPLFAMAFVQYAKGLAPNLGVSALVTALLLVTAVGSRRGQRSPWPGAAQARDAARAR